MKESTMTTYFATITIVPALLGLPQPSTQTMIIVAAAIAILFALGAFVTSRPTVKVRVSAGYDRAFAWIDRAIAAWETDGRLSADEAERLRAEMREPEFTAVLPHFGVHLAIGVVLRFPLGSIVRASYVLANMGLAHIRLVTRRIDYATFRRLMGIHSPLVLVLTSFPGIGTFGYLASKPFRGHHLLALVALDAVLLKLPRNVYERSGLRTAIVRPTVPGSEQRVGRDRFGNPFLRLNLVPARVLLVLTVLVGALFAADVIVQTLDAIYAPTFQGWKQLSRIFDLGSESSLGTWLAVTMLFLCAVVLALIASVRHKEGDRFARHWTFLAILLLALSMDEQAKFHDAGGGAHWRETLGLGGFLYYGWVVIALVSVLVLALIYRKFIAHLPNGVRTALLVAAGFYVGGEVAVEMLNGWLMDNQGDTYLYRTTTSVEELFGMVGVLIALGTLLIYAASVVGTVSVSVIRVVQQADRGPIVGGQRVFQDTANRASNPIHVPAME